MLLYLLAENISLILLYFELMKRSGFENYRLVYSHLWKTYGQSWHVRAAFIIRFITRILKLVALPILTSKIIEGIAVGNYSVAQFSLMLYVFSSLALALLTPLESYVSMIGENKVYAEATKTYFSKLLNVDIKYFNDNLAGYLTSATRQYIDNSIQMIRTMRGTYLNTVLTILLPLIVIVTINSVIGIVVITLGIMQAAYLLWSSQIIAPYRQESREYYKKTSGFFSDVISNILAVKSSSQEVESSSRASSLIERESRSFKERFVMQSKLVLPREIITVVFLGVVFALTINFSKNSGIGLGDAVLIFTYSLTILTGLYSLSSDIDQHDDFVDKIIPAFDVLDRKNDVENPSRPKNFKKIAGNIHLKNISFSYKEKKSETLVFDKLSLDIPAGQKIGVVGLSGAGKSTLAKLLLRFDDIDSGSITVDDIDIRDVLQADLRCQIAYVPQEPLLFHSTIKENVLLSKPDATDKEVAAAIKSAHVSGFIEQLPDKLNSIVGERGVKLSGGQKQRIAIARAVLQNSPIIILDEATSALDSESEDIIKSSFKEILKCKTAVVVAHRLSTLSDMDRIIVIDKGEIVEDGTHQQLVARKGLYATLWKRQQMHLEEPYVGNNDEA